MDVDPHPPAAAAPRADGLEGGELVADEHPATTITATNSATRRRIWSYYTAG